MTKNKITRFSAALIGALSMVGLYQPEAHARTIPAWAGTPTQGSAMANFSIITNGVRNNTTTSSSWTVPLVFDSAGAITVQVRGKVSSGSGMTCLGFTISPAGALLGTTAPQSFPASGAFTNLSFNFTTAMMTANAQGGIMCTMAGNGATFLGVEY